MLSYNELRPGQFIVWEGNLYEVLDASFLRMQQRKPVMKVKLRDVIAQKVKETSFQQSDELEEAELDKMKCLFLYKAKGDCWFNEVGNPQNRFTISEATIGSKAQFLKPNSEVLAIVFDEKIINIQLPVKMDFEVTEAPPSIKGNTSSGGMKQVTLETGARVNTPLFINTGDVVRINTETGDYVERVQK